MCSWPVWGRFRDLVCDYLWLASGPLYDLFENVIARRRVTCLDVNMYVLMYWHVMSFICKWPLHGLIVCVSLLEPRMICCMLMLIYVCIIY